MSGHLHREFAPIGKAAWEEIEDTAKQILREYLAGRKLVDVRGPLGWEHACEPSGRASDVNGAGVRDGVKMRRRESVPMIEIQAEFSLDRDELDDIDRGRPNPDLEPVVDAARRLAMAEDGLIFSGLPEVGMAGLASSTRHAPIPISSDYATYPNLVASAVATLRREGVAGPYAIALGPRCYQGVIETTENGGYPLLEHLRLILDGPVVWAPAVDGAVVLSQRGGDVELVIGEDVSIGYRSHDAKTVALYLEESVTVLVNDESSAVRLAYP